MDEVVDIQKVGPPVVLTVGRGRQVFRPQWPLAKVSVQTPEHHQHDHVDGSQSATRDPL